MRFVASVGFLAFYTLSGGVTRAAPMTYEFTGVIDWVNDPSELLEDSLQIGEQFLGRFTFDSGAVDLNISNILGDFSDPSFSMLLEVGPYSWFSGTGNGKIRVQNSDLDGLTFGTDPFTAGDDLSLSMAGGLSDSTGRVFSTDELPIDPLPLSAFDGAWLSVKGGGVPPAPGKLDLVGHITTFSVVPEPVNMLLMAFGLVPLQRRGLKSSF